MMHKHELIKSNNWPSIQSNPIQLNTSPASMTASSFS